jgi:uncharacterized protein YecE (DUF72 family)
MNLYVGTSGYPYKEWNGSVEIKKRIDSFLVCSWNFTNETMRRH